MKAEKMKLSETDKRFWGNFLLFLFIPFIYGFLDELLGYKTNPAINYLISFFIVWNRDICRESKDD